MDKCNKTNPRMNQSLLESSYIIGLQMDDDAYNDIHDDVPAVGISRTIDDEYKMLMSNNNNTNAKNNAGGISEFFDDEDEQLFAKYLAEISTTTGEADDQYDASNQNEEIEQFESSFVDALAVHANTNISTMKSDVDEALRDTQSSQIHLINYKEFIEKKKKQRVQCLRDIQIHCCQCQGPHISKPPFSHGQDYRREPIHPQRQGNKCLFLKKKRAELKWLDETLGNYSKNTRRFELEIERRKAKIETQKEKMQNTLANSLRLMEIASDDG